MATEPDPSRTRKSPVSLLPEPADGFGAVEVAALVATVFWLLLSGIYFLTGRPSDQAGLGFLMAAMVIVLPIAMIWVAALTARSTRVLRAESARLQAAIDAIRAAYVAQMKTQQGAGEAPHPALTKRLDEIAATQKALESGLTRLTTARVTETALAQSAATAIEGEDQPALSLGTPAEALEPPLSNSDFIRALNFPETADDKPGFAALRRALKDRTVKQLVQASQDVLTLLSQEGIYMDDLRPDLSRPEIWRAFAEGKRGRAIASLGGVRDRSSLALTAGRMKQDPIFRDAAHHFLRLFDRTFAGFASRASDSEITEFAGTRTARAFMLLGRVAGTFD
ncbi:hypothetical protein KUH32_04570 [Thalassococcus sp. CAU 1522]|uniref:Uncharacterized protein n=1 Tax=Thalassococcus arenae TaxID=2851652 RepID=A0ABS6N690_9RHOB|nr:hypothetical protein [Thalassococcus arenae]MBV2359040.1 hypothetical protein [Thalassococcus arenae]